MLGASRAQKKPTLSNKKQVGKTQDVGKIGVLMLGRSVMGGWFEHWGSDTSSPVKREGFTLYYGELNTPPEIVNSAEEKVGEYSDKIQIVFFKLCFDDFESGSRSEAKENLSQNKEYVEEVYQIMVKENGFKLIIGNALPKVKNYTNSDLVWNHREYNKWLDEFAQKHPGEVYIFDQYSILSTSEGNLKKEYAIDVEDSHPNDAAYSALDGFFFALLRTLD